MKENVKGELHLAGFDPLLRFGTQRLDHRLAIQRLRGVDGRLETEALLDGRFERAEVPVFGMGIGRAVLADDRVDHLFAEVEQALALLDHRRRDLVGQAIERRGPVFQYAGRIEVGAEILIDEGAKVRRLQRHGRDGEATRGVDIGNALFTERGAHARQDRADPLGDARDRVLTRLRWQPRLHRGAALFLFVCRLRRVAAPRETPPGRVNRLALLIHDIVVLEQVLADVEVVPLDLLLRVLDGAVDEAVLDRHVLFHPQALHET